ncbi:putative oligomerization/nucleic acid binding protein [Actinophytocola oryzae]|uniref:Putative oligomerization/nucleic acid binding protein n=2 Tax=Actinophytocola oryzae TaxID=502181 RepID=A0A4R7VWB7_9PSEU|nr:putative oligomerization/nucleic acid binding protein [Actinophytocola oryzae]
MTDGSRPDIQAAKDKMQTRLGAGREMKRLTNHLWEHESVHLMAAGRYGGGTGLVVLTDRRLLFVMDGMTRKTIEDFPMDKISSVQWSSGMVLGTLAIFASGNKADIDQMNKKDGKQIADAVRARLARPAPAPIQPAPMIHHAPPVPAANAPDVYEQLRKLGELRDLGVVTSDEFEAKKHELLSRI